MRLSAVLERAFWRAVAYYEDEGAPDPETDAWVSLWDDADALGREAGRGGKAVRAFLEKREGA